MNTTTLNMTTLDGGVIIKRGNAPAPPSGGESGGGDWHYFDVSEVDMTDPSVSIQVVFCYMMVKFPINDKMWIGPSSLFELAEGFSGGKEIKVSAFGGDYTQRVIVDGRDAPYSTLIEELKAQGVGLTEITKEQFYTLE